MPKMHGSMMKNMADQMMSMEEMDFTPILANIPTDAEDGEAVFLVIKGYAKGGKLTDIQAVDMDMSDEPEEKKGLEDMLSPKKEDGSKEEE